MNIFWNTKYCGMADSRRSCQRPHTSASIAVIGRQNLFVFSRADCRLWVNVARQLKYTSHAWVTLTIVLPTFFCRCSVCSLNEMFFGFCKLCNVTVSKPCESNSRFCGTRCYCCNFIQPWISLFREFWLIFYRKSTTRHNLILAERCQQNSCYEDATMFAAKYGDCGCRRRALCLVT